MPLGYFTIDQIYALKINDQFSSVQSLSRVQLFATPWTEACQARLSFTISCGLLKLMSIESMMPSNHLILFAPFCPCPQSFPASGSLPMSLFFTSGLPLHHQESPNICHFWPNLSLTILFPQRPLPSPAERERHQQFTCSLGFPLLRIPHEEEAIN